MREDGAILVGAGEGRQVDELSRLASTLGMTVLGRLEQGRRDGSGYLGRGKREELAGLVRETGAGFVVADDELSASQARVLEKASGASVVDRTELIIRIFEAHARDAASRLEVELADLEYRLPRVKGRNPELSRLGGGASGGAGGGGGGARRGPGEQQLEYDRRVLRARMDTINRKLRGEKAARAVRASRLKKGGTPKVSLVGYTNAGKTTILNALSGAERSTKDRLFETLETTTRLVAGTPNGTPNGNPNGSDGHGAARPDFVITDTVGFIRKLPTQLVHSFASTLEAAADADLLVLCADASSVSLEEEISTVRRTLADSLGDSYARAAHLLCLNKRDLVPEEELARLESDHPDAVFVSAAGEREGWEPLLERIYAIIAAGRERMRVLIPHADFAEASRLYGMAEIHASESTPEGVSMDVSIPRSASHRYEPYRLSEAR